MSSKLMDNTLVETDEYQIKFLSDLISKAIFKCYEENIIPARIAESIQAERKMVKEFLADYSSIAVSAFERKYFNGENMSNYELPALYSKWQQLKQQEEYKMNFLNPKLPSDSDYKYPQHQPEKHAEVCPVCGGTGKLPTTMITDPTTPTVRCHGCNGLGWITV